MLIALAMGAAVALPANASAQGIISALSVSPSMGRGGASALGTVTLIPDAAPTTVLLFSSVRSNFGGSATATLTR